MSIFNGTNADETIAPDFVSPSVGVSGDAGFDAFELNSNDASETFSISAIHGLAKLTGDVGKVTAVLDTIENIVLNAGGGADAIVVRNLAGSDVQQVAINLADASGAAPDGQIDRVTLEGSKNANFISVLGGGSSISVLNDSTFVSIAHSEAADELTIRGLGGDDDISATGADAGLDRLRIDAGAGDDLIDASALEANLFQFSAFAGAGDDVFEWNPGEGSDASKARPARM